MVEQIGICETHELPLDNNGDCELCRLVEMPSRAPKAGSPVWLIIIPVLVVLGVSLWAYSKVSLVP